MPGAILYGNPVYRSHPLAQGLAGFWLGLPGLSAGPKLWDYSGFSRYGTLTNGPTWVAGSNGFGALRFVAASNQEVAVDSVPYFSPWTMAAVVLPDSAGAGQDNQPVFTMGSAASGGYGPYLTTGGAKVNIYTGAGWVNGTTTVSTTQWSLIGASSSTTAGTTIYLNGRLDATSATNTVSAIGTGRRIGSRVDGGGFFDGRIAAVWWVSGLAAAGWHAALYDQWQRGFPDLLRRVRPWVYVGPAAAPAVFCPDLSIQSIPHRTHPKMVAY